MDEPLKRSVFDDNMMTQIDAPDFSLLLPEGAWSDHSTPDAYEYQLANEEQLMAVVHVAREPLNQASLQAGVTEIFRIRLNAIQEYSQNSCKFESPELAQEPGKFDVSIVGHDRRENILMQIGIFRRPHKTLVVTYYDYAGRRNVEEFRERVKGVMESVTVL